MVMWFYSHHIITSKSLTVTRQVELKLLPKEATDEKLIRQRAIQKSRYQESEVTHFRVLKKSIDARGNRPFILVRAELFINEPYQAEPAILSTFQNVSDKQEIIIVGAGPAGYFAALQCIELGLKPIVLDRGKDVQARRRDLRAIQQFGIVNPHSNYCFGEGGAGTYSDGKLYTRAHKRGNIERILNLLVEHGAKTDILIDAHPHIGSNKLPKIVQNLRETILHFGGEVHFNSYVNDLIIKNHTVRGVIVDENKEYWSNAVILATGHSARGIYKMLHEKGIRIEAKPFALGVRIEHAQQVIDKAQYNQEPREMDLPAASYRLACQVDQRGVFSFCMCPGGLVVPAATAPGEIVVNGMSMSRRDSAYANSGTVVAIELEDLTPLKHYGVFAGMEFQKAVEQKLFKHGDGSQKAPAQRLTDFVKGKLSNDLPSSSYIPGLYSSPLHELLPPSIYQRLAKGVKVFGKKMKTYFTHEANVIGTESRTSAPIRIPRNRLTFMHDDVKGLFPCGEGAGYAGGIISAAMDGQNVAKAVANFIKP